MRLNEKTVKRFEELLELGNKVLNTRRKPPPNVFGDDSVDSQLANQWITSVQTAFNQIFGENNEYYKNFAKQTDSKSPSFSPVNRAYGVLLAAKSDYENGYITGMKTLIEAEIFDDFLEQSEHLLLNGYFQASAVIAGSVLEDSLRKMCEKASIILSEKPKLDSMNTELSKNGVYDKLVQKKITAIADLRNKAAHGEWDKFVKEDVEEMIVSMRNFLDKYNS